MAAIALVASLGQTVASGSGFADAETSALVSKSLSEWSSSRGCLYTSDTVKFLLGTMLGAGQKVSRAKIQPAMESYLDWVTLQKFGPLRAGCIVGVPLLQDFPFDVPMYGGPRTGYLTVDGTMKSDRRTPTQSPQSTRAFVTRPAPAPAAGHVLRRHGHATGEF